MLASTHRVRWVLACAAAVALVASCSSGTADRAADTIDDVADAPANDDTGADDAADGDAVADAAADDLDATDDDVADDEANDDTDEVASSDTSPDEPPPEFVPTACAFEIEVSVEVDCGIVEVRESRSVDDGAIVELAVAILRTPADDPAPDPVVFLQGGPGGVSLARHGTWLGDGDDWQDHPILARRDLILIDQRGVGYSRPSLWCDEVGGETPRACQRRLVDDGVDLSRYSTRESAADLADVRLALGLDEWNLFGASYGTRLALVTLRDHPDGVRTVLLEGVLPPDVVPTAHEHLDRGIRSIDEVAAACAADEQCSSRFGDVGEMLIAALRAADADDDDRLDAVELVNRLMGALLGVDGVRALPLITELVVQGEVDDALALLDRVDISLSEPRSDLEPGVTEDDPSGGDPQVYSVGLHLSIQCREDAAFAERDLIFRRGDQLIASGVDPLLLQGLYAGIGYTIEWLCPRWESGIADPDERRPVSSEVPALLLSGRFDPVTPPGWGDRAAGTLDRATHVVAPSLSHTLVLRDPCIDSIVAEFLDQPDSAPDVSCVAGMLLGEFDTLDP